MHHSWDLGQEKPGIYNGYSISEGGLSVCKTIGRSVNPTFSSHLRYSKPRRRMSARPRHPSAPSGARLSLRKSGTAPDTDTKGAEKTSVAPERLGFMQGEGNKSVHTGNCLRSVAVQGCIPSKHGHFGMLILLEPAAPVGAVAVTMHLSVS